MSRKVFGYLLLDVLLVGIVTIIFWWLKGICNLIEPNLVKTIVDIALKVICGVIDGILIFLFLLYWWSDRKWTAIKRKFKR